MRCASFAMSSSCSRWPEAGRANVAASQYFSKSIAQILGVFDGELVLDKQLRFVQALEIARLAVYRCKPLKFWPTKTWPKLIGTIVKWLAFRQTEHCNGS
jgi:hypothetical protein